MEQDAQNTPQTFEAGRSPAGGLSWHCCEAVPGGEINAPPFIGCVGHDMIATLMGESLSDLQGRATELGEAPAGTRQIPLHKCGDVLTRPFGGTEKLKGNASELKCLGFLL